ncbi:MAG: EthD family reductase [Dehalococcoidia bacterium]|nr:EthD family reductase [Dehalococcoidia bacterium]
MVKLTLIYRMPGEGQFFDEEHYHKVHVAEALSFVGKYRCRRLVLGKAITDVPERQGRQPGIYRTTELYFDNLDDARACVFSPEMRNLNPDAKNYHNTATESLFQELEVYEFNDDGTLKEAIGAWAEHFAPLIGQPLPEFVFKER